MTDEMTTAEIEAFLAKHRKTVGQRVTYSGFSATVTKICDWTDGGMVEIRLSSGTACVSASDCIPA